MKGTHFYSDASIAELYSWFADETASSSPTWERLCRWIVETPEVQHRLDTLLGRKRQPNLFLAALRFLDGPLDPGADLLRWLDARWGAVVDVVLTHQTQTNELGRAATLAPVLAGVGERIALVEVGMSAGLLLFPDRYGYRWRTPSGVVSGGRDDVAVVECRVEGEPRFPLAVPQVVWRAGIDLNPLDPGDPDDARWLRALVWPGQPEREARLASALAMAASEPVLRVTGDALEELAGVVAQAPAEATVVVMHSAALAYLPRESRAEFEALVRSLPGFGERVRWVSNEGERVLSTTRDLAGRAAASASMRTPPTSPVGVATTDPSRDPEPTGTAGQSPALEPSFVLALDGEPIARTGPHGQFLHWW